MGHLLGVGVTPRKTSTGRVKERVRRLIMLGMKELRGLWAHPDDHKSIRDYAALLWGQRENGKEKRD